MKHPEDGGTLRQGMLGMQTPLPLRGESFVQMPPTGDPITPICHEAKGDIAFKGRLRRCALCFADVDFHAACFYFLPSPQINEISSISALTLALPHRPRDCRGLKGLRRSGTPLWKTLGAVLAAQAMGDSAARCSHRCFCCGVPCPVVVVRVLGVRTDLLIGSCCGPMCLEPRWIRWLVRRQEGDGTRWDPSFHL